MDIVVVIAAGNDGYLPDSLNNPRAEFLDEQLPAMHGSSSNQVITVGGVWNDGSLLVESTPARAGRPGSITVYAQAANIECMGEADGSRSVDKRGTSFAAPVVVCHCSSIVLTSANLGVGWNDCYVACF